MADNDNENNGLERGLRRLINSDANRRHLRSMPAFKLDGNSSAFDDLLSRIDAAEAQRHRGH